MDPLEVPTDPSLQAELLSLRQRVADLSASEAELRAMFHAMTDVVLVMSAKGRYLKIGPTGTDLLYKPSDELLGKTLYEVMPAEAADFFLSRIRAALETRSVVTMDYSLPIQDKTVWFSANISPMSADTVVIVARDVTERKQAEEQLRTQSAALTALSTPLIPITDEIVIMPLIGVLDEQRVRQTMETLLAGIAARRARVAILDVTGISGVDARVADALVGVARAAQLLGAEVLLTGIRPEVAEMLTSIGSDLRGIVTCGTLQTGVASAMSGGARPRGRP